jgi:putative transposon-encoded protein
MMRTATLTFESRVHLLGNGAKQATAKGFDEVLK